MSLRSVEALTRSEIFPIRIKNYPPYVNLLATTAELPNKDQVVGKSHGMDASWFSWQTIRKNGADSGNGRINFGTGFEGYLIGEAESPEKAMDHLLQMGTNAWNYVRGIHKHSWAKRNEMEKTIRGDGYTIASLEEWSAIFAAMLARERIVFLKNPQARDFNIQTKKTVARLPKIDYSMTEAGLIVEEYALPREEIIPVSPTGLTKDQEFSWLIMQNIGRFGHPLLRSFLSNNHS